MKHGVPLWELLKERRDEKFKEQLNAIPQGIGQGMEQEAGGGPGRSDGGSERPVGAEEVRHEEAEAQDNVAPKKPRAPAKKVPRKKG